jgi:serine O-acetyltransferase
MSRADPTNRFEADSPVDSGVVDRTVAELSAATSDALVKAASEGFPNRADVADWVERTKRLVLVQREPAALRSEVPQLAQRLLALLDRLALPNGCTARGAVEAFLPRLAPIRALLADDVEAAFEGDPAARSFAEIVVAYPSIRAIAIHRIAHELHALRVPILPRLMGEHAHDLTGIDIHPGAQIGRRFFIDHGTGVVIGETTIIGDNVRLYQGVTLGARSPRHGESLRGVKRHPTIEDDVTIYAGVTILGGDVVIGRGSVIGGNVWLTESVPPGSKVIAESPRTMVRQRESRRSEPAPLDWDI